jgi:uncharacterized membrane protein
MSPTTIRFHVSRAVFLLGVLPAWCLALFAFRTARAGIPGYHYVVWNLVLAVVPAAAALLLVRAERQRASLPEQAGWFALWLLFLPNAPYLLTDLVHLSSRPPVPLWFDVAMLLSFACTGLLLCYGSVADVHAVVARRFGSVAGWTLAMTAMLLSGLGIYMGRFLRLNSWDAVTRPHTLLGYVANAVSEPSSNLPGLRVTLVYGIGLALGYAAVHLILPADMPRRPGTRDRS